MKKVLITGGAGFIGSEIVTQLYKQGGWDVTVVDVMAEQIHGEDMEKSYLYKKIQGKCNFICGDLCDYRIAEKSIAENQYIIHLAAETGTGQSMYQINQYNKVNIMGTSNLFQAISNQKKDCKVNKIILSSSRSVYGEGKYICPKCGIVYPDSRKKENMLNGDFRLYCPACDAELKLVPTTENSEIKPCSLYAFTKYAQEQMLKTMCPALDIDYTIVRFQNVYGVGQSLKNPYTGILSVFSALLLENKPVNIFEDGLESRDFINVADAASGVIACLSASKSNSQIINIGSGKGTSVIKIAKYLKEAYRSESKLNITGDFRVGDIAHNVADITKAKKILGFEQKVFLEQGLDEFCNWVIHQDNDCGRYEASLVEMENSGMFIRKKGKEQ